MDKIIVSGTGNGTMPSFHVVYSHENTYFPQCTLVPRLSQIQKLFQQGVFFIYCKQCLRTAQFLYPLMMLCLSGVSVFSRPMVFGVHAGAGMSRLRGAGFDDCISRVHRLQYAEEIENEKVKTGLLYSPAVGVSASTMFGSIAGATLEFWYRLKGMAYTYPVNGRENRYDLTIHYLTVPLKMVVYSPGYSSVFPYLYGGLYGSMLLDAQHRGFHSEVVDRYGSTMRRETQTEVVIRNHLKWYDAGLIAGGGMEIGLGIRGILIDACVEVGASTIAEYLQHSPLFNHSLRTATLYLTVGYEIRFFDL